MEIFTNIPGARAGASSVAAPRLSLTTLQKVAIPVGAIWFYILFWEERPALNVLLYTGFVLVVGLAGLPRRAPQWRSGGFQLTLAGTVLSAALVAWYGSAVALLAWVASSAMWLGYRNQPHLKLVVYALCTAVSSASRAVPRLAQLMLLPRNLDGRVERVWFYGRLLILPLVALLVFHILFAIANPVYSEITGRVLDIIGEWVEAFFEIFSIPRFLFFVFGLALTGAALVLVPVHYFADQESRFGEFIVRQRDRVASFAVRRPDFRAKRFRALDLRKEYLVALSMLGLVNVLLLIVNGIDINWIWFGFTPAPGFDLTQFVHEGTYVLILSILVAMGIVLWFFRRNLNFYERGLPRLRWLATVWVLQNAVLAVSVGLRNYYYILYTGLAYKRIGVYFFLLLTFFGLATVLLKIWQRRSAYSLVRLNMLAAYVLMVGLACGNWEIWIARYNLRPELHELDYGFLLDMPDRVLPILAAHPEVLTQRHLVHEHYSSWITLNPDVAAQRLERRLARFKAVQGARKWPSYTYTDWQAYQQMPRWVWHGL
ncbi:hypothetical protein SAMN00120144_0282 [Hymenobacter roseosalivarius DSM 11622]|uniref:Uncharacterized protein n=1 Tax=Hymenobacter roseosalivarius DSM 11622 TaxID=645990 RepID=A0A1W1VV31_9BACT|nr:DUF4173 domain-containing protein [Hymenobacter roseosalivarius]SMB97080.1 hypothetical protein SAMN00120144_0282 [Hymenobacter roseosalivarius DSM 11622]